MVLCIIVSYVTVWFWFMLLEGSMCIFIYDMHTHVLLFCSVFCSFSSSQCLVCCSLIYLFLLSCVVSLSDYYFRLLIEILTILQLTLFNLFKG